MLGTVREAEKRQPESLLANNVASHGEIGDSTTIALCTIYFFKEDFYLVLEIHMV